MHTPPIADLPARLAAIDDPRHARGRRHTIGCILAVALCAILSGARTLRAIGQWSQAAPQHALERLDARITNPDLGTRTAPSPSTIRRALTLCAPAAVAALARPPAIETLAIDGKTLRGTAGGDTAAVHVIAAMDPTGRIAAQLPLAARTSEIAAVEDLLGPLDIAGAVVTADALHTQHTTARLVAADYGADYVLTVKANQPALYEQFKHLPWAQAPTGATSRHRGHGRAETRTAKALTVGGLRFPHAAQAVRIRRHITDLRTKKSSWTCAYVVTSLPAERAGADRIASLVRGHWQIEALHHVRDATFGEDACKARAGQAPANLASLRSLAIALLRRLGMATVPDAIRWISYECFTRPLDLLGLS